MEKVQFTQLQNMIILMDIDALGIQTGPVSAYSTHFVLKIFHLFTFIQGSPFLLPQRGNIGKREITQLQNWMRQRASSALGNQTGPFAAH